MKKVKIIEEDCIACGQCQAIAPEVFEVDDVAVVIVDSVPEELIDDVQDAIEACPTGAIVWDEDEDKDKGED